MPIDSRFDWPEGRARVELVEERPEGRRWEFASDAFLHLEGVVVSPGFLPGPLLERIAGVSISVRVTWDSPPPRRWLAAGRTVPEAVERDDGPAILFRADRRLTPLPDYERLEPTPGGPARPGD